MKIEIKGVNGFKRMVQCCPTPSNFFVLTHPIFNETCSECGHKKSFTRRDMWALTHTLTGFCVSRQPTKELASVITWVIAEELALKLVEMLTAANIYWNATDIDHFKDERIQCIVKKVYDKFQAFADEQYEAQNNRANGSHYDRTERKRKSGQPSATATRFA